MARTNTSDKQMWVASDPHPAHNVLPGFDQSGTGGNVQTREKTKNILKKSGIFAKAYAHSGTNTVYRYTFLKPGNWPYHNHLSPNDKGKVIVN